MSEVWMFHTQRGFVTIYCIGRVSACEMALLQDLQVESNASKCSKQSLAPLIQWVKGSTLHITLRKSEVIFATKDHIKHVLKCQNIANLSTVYLSYMIEMFFKAYRHANNII